MIKKSFLSYKVCSDLPDQAVITSAFAKDPDAGENGTVTFALREGKEYTQYLIYWCLVVIND